MDQRLVIESLHQEKGFDEQEQEEEVDARIAIDNPTVPMAT